MFNSTEILIDAFVDRLQLDYRLTYGHLQPHFPNLIAWAGRMALENIVNTDALYHNIEHTIMATLAGQQILKGKQALEGKVSPEDWLHFVLSLLYHDIGFVRSICREDREGLYTTGIAGEYIRLPWGATDASLTPYHVDRGKLFIYERFGNHPIINVEVIAANIERTRFPVPEDEEHRGTQDYPGLVRAADLIGQLADPHYLRKLTALFHEFAETGMNEQFGYRYPADLRKGYPAFYRNIASRYIQEGLNYLRVMQEGKQWIANLYGNVSVVEHEEFWGGDTYRSTVCQVPISLVGQVSILSEPA